MGRKKNLPPQRFYALDDPTGRFRAFGMTYRTQMGARKAFMKMVLKHEIPEHMVLKYYSYPGHGDKLKVEKVADLYVWRRFGFVDYIYEPVHDAKKVLNKNGSLGGYF